METLLLMLFVLVAIAIALLVGGLLTVGFTVATHPELRAAVKHAPAARPGREPAVGS